MNQLIVGWREKLKDIVFLSFVLPNNYQLSGKEKKLLCIFTLNVFYFQFFMGSLLVFFFKLLFTKLSRNILNIKSLMKQAKVLKVGNKKKPGTRTASEAQLKMKPAKKEKSEFAKVQSFSKSFTY
jgi:hypothetical protein